MFNVVASRSAQISTRFFYRDEGGLAQARSREPSAFSVLLGQRLLPELAQRDAGRQRLGVGLDVDDGRLGRCDRTLECVQRALDDARLTASRILPPQRTRAMTPLFAATCPSRDRSTMPLRRGIASAAITTQIDYEAELAIVIGTGGRNIARADAMKHVFGYTIVDDVTARDVQMRHQQWDLGKSFDTFCPMGPWIVTPDEMDGTDTRVRCWVTPAGGEPELRQDGRTTDLIFDIPTLIETCSRGITLYPGDVIATGTPAGVGMGMTPPQWLRHGDVVRVQIDGIGEIENRFVDEVGA